MKDNSFELPPLPTVYTTEGTRPKMWFTAAEVNRLRIEAIEADRKRRGEPVGWQPIETAPHGEEVLLGWLEWEGVWKAEVSPASWGWSTKTVSNISAHGQATHWMPIPPAPQPAEPVKRQEAKSQIPTWAEVSAIDEAGPVKVPSDEEILDIAKQPGTCPCPPWVLVDDVKVGEVRCYVLAFARALLARYGQPAQPAASAEPRLYQHTDGRYGLSFGPAKFAKGEPAWYSVPIDVYEDEGR